MTLAVQCPKNFDELKECGLKDSAIADYGAIILKTIGERKTAGASKVIASFVSPSSDVFNFFSKSDNTEPVKHVNIAEPIKDLSSTINNTFYLFQQGKKAQDIAKIRKLSEGVITDHLCECISKGYIDVKAFIPERTYKAIVSKLKDNWPRVSLSELHTNFNNIYDYSTIKYAVAAFEYMPNLI